MTPGTPTEATAYCWDRIGVYGDRSCPELKQHVHCRNCPVTLQATTELLLRPAPAQYLEEWVQRFATPPHEEPQWALTALVFRVAEEWFALPVEVVVEIAEPRVVRSIPQLTQPLLLGLTNVRGELQLCVSLRTLLGLGREDLSFSGPHQPEQADSVAKPAHVNPRRMVVVEHDGARWVFLVDQVAYVRRFDEASVKPVPATITPKAGNLCSRLLHCPALGDGDRFIAAKLDRAVLFAALSKAFA